jgi:hypothetical protein
MKLPTRSLLLATLLATATVFAGSPRLNHTYPAVGQRGTEMEITCKGGNLADAKSLMFNSGAIQSTAIVKAEGGQVVAKIKIAPDAKIGEHAYRVITASGVSDLRLFYVTPFPIVEKKREKEQPDAPLAVALGTTVYGHTQGESQDHFEVELKKGQRLGVEIIGARLQTQSIFDPHLTIAKAGGGVIDEIDDCAFSRQDPVASFVAPEDGKYRLTVKDATNSGPGECHYVLNVGSFPRPLAVYPAGGQTGETLKVRLLGDAAGPLERELKLPANPTERFELLAEDGQPAPQPNRLRVSPFPNVLEVEPNDDIAHGVPNDKPLPIALNGIIEKVGDVDHFKVTAKKGEVFDVKVYARRLRSPLDSVLTIWNAKGGQAAGNDDEGNLDSGLRWTVGEDGDYFVKIEDKLGRGGPTYVYRVELTRVTPRLAVWLPEMVINSNQERRAIVVPKGNRYATLVRVRRVDVGGDAIIEPAELPAGVTPLAGPMDKSVDTIPMVFEAAPDAAQVAKYCTFNVKLAEPPKDTVVPSTVEHDLDVAENGNQRSFYSVSEHRLPVAVTDEVPVKIALAQPKVPILRNGSMNLKVTAERKGDFKGAISVALLYGPPGIGNPGTVAIPEGKDEGTVTISANGDAPVRKWKICVAGTVDLGKGPVWISTNLVDLEVAEPFVAGGLTRNFIDQSESGTMTLKLDQKVPFDGKAKLVLLGLPQGVTAEEREVSKDDKEVKFPIKAAPDAQVGQARQLFVQFNLTRDGELMQNTFAGGGILRVDKASVAAK